MGNLENLKKRSLICLIIGTLSFLTFVAGARGYGDFYFGTPQALGIRGILALVLAILYIILCVAFLKERNLVIQNLGVKYAKGGAVCGIFAAVATLITEGIFAPLLALIWEFVQGNLVGILFIIPMIIDGIGIIALILIGAQLGFYLAGIVMQLLLYHSLRGSLRSRKEPNTG